MKYSKLFLAAIVGLMACQTAAASDSNQSFDGSRPELEENLSLNRDHSSEAMFYAKFDAYSTWFEKNLTDNNISPKMGLGYRYRRHHHGFDIAFSGHMSKEYEFETTVTYQSIMETLPSRSRTEVIKFKGVSNYLAGQLTYLYYIQRDSRNTFYFGAGAGVDRIYTVLRCVNKVLEDLDGNQIIGEFGSLSGLLIAGYQFDLYDTMKSFLQFQVSQPAYDYIRFNDSGYGLKLSNQWLLTVSMSAGVGF